MTEAKTQVPFNVNDSVFVRLTDHGRRIHRDQFRSLYGSLSPTASITYSPPKEDEGGWSRWQLWHLMETFGDHVGMARELPFETTIKFDAGT